MTIRGKLEKLFNDSGVPFEAICHHRTSTASQTAKAEHMPTHYQAKVVVVRVDGKDALAVVPADCWVNVDKLKCFVGARSVTIEFEDDFKGLFKDCEPGAMPPFGKLFAMPLYADASLAENEGICFNAGTHKDAMCMQWSDYAKLAKPVIGEFADSQRRCPGPRF